MVLYEVGYIKLHAPLYSVVVVGNGVALCRGSLDLKVMSYRYAQLYTIRAVDIGLQWPSL